MANTTTQYLDPAMFSNAAIAGRAELPADPLSTFYSKVIPSINQLTGASSELLDTTATTLSLAVGLSSLSVSGTMAFTLPDGTYAGQRHTVTCTVAASTPAATLTVATPETAAPFICASTFFFDTVGQSVTFSWTGTKWRATSVTRTGGVADGVVIGTTVISTKNLWRNYYCSVTGTVSSTTTKGIPNGSAIGEACTVRVSTAATIPSGTISLTGLTNAGAAATTLGTMAATTNYADLRWNGSAWEVIGNTTLVMS